MLDKQSDLSSESFVFQIHPGGEDDASTLTASEDYRSYFDTSTVSTLTMDLQTSDFLGNTTSSSTKMSREDKEQNCPLLNRVDSLEVLETALKRVSKYPFTRELVVVMGQVGVGKTALIESFRRHHKNTCWIGCGEWHNHTTLRPYGALLEAYSELIEIVLSDDDEMEHYRAAIRKEMGDSVYTLTHLLPNLEQLAGLCGVPSTSSCNNKMEHAFSRVKEAFVSLLRALSSPRHPLVVILEDLHHSDKLSSQILKSIIDEVELQHVLFVVTSIPPPLFPNEEQIGSEQKKTKPEIFLAIQLLQSRRCRTTKILLKELSQDDVYFLTASILQEESSSITVLSKIIHCKTNGNPFFVKQFLKYLKYQDILTRSTGAKWRYDSGHVREAAILSGCSLEVTLAVIQNTLPPMVQQLLCFASCLGRAFAVDRLEQLVDAYQNDHDSSPFTLATQQPLSSQQRIHDTLRVAARLGYRFQHLTTQLIYGAVEHQNLDTIAEEDDEDEDISNFISFERKIAAPNLSSIQVAVCLACATKEGWIFQQTQNEEQFYFVHEIVQAAIWEFMKSISITYQAQLQRWIGQVMREDDAEFNPENPSYFLCGVDQLNSGPVEDDEDTFLSLMSLNIEAAALTLEQYAFGSSRHYLRRAFELQQYAQQVRLEEDELMNASWREDYESRLEWYTLAAQVELACDNYVQADEYAEQVFCNAETFQDQQQACLTRLSALRGMGQRVAAQELTIQTLRKFGHKFPPIKKYSILSEFRSVNNMLSKMTKEAFIMLQPMESDQLSEVQLLASLCYSASDIKIMALAAFKIVKLVITCGFHEAGPLALAIVGLFHSHQSNIDLALRIGSFSRNLMLQHFSTIGHHIKARTHLILSNFVFYWEQDFEKVQEGTKKAYFWAQASGDQALMQECTLHSLILQFLQGNIPLKKVSTQLQYSTLPYSAASAVEEINPLLLQACLNLSNGETAFPCRLTGEVVAEGILLQQAEEQNHDSVVYAAHLIKLPLCIIFHEWELAEELLAQCVDAWVRPHVSQLYLSFMKAFVHIIRFHETLKFRYKRTMKKFIADFRNLVEDKGVDKLCEPFFALLLAEEAASTAPANVVMDAFNCAVRYFSKNNSHASLLYQAIANERCGRNLLAYHQDKKATAHSYLLKARACYHTWGATCKVRLLDDELVRSQITMQTITK